MGHQWLPWKLRHSYQWLQYRSLCISPMLLACIACVNINEPKCIKFTCDLSEVINNQLIDKLISTQFLRVNLDENFQWSDNIKWPKANYPNVVLGSCVKTRNVFHQWTLMALYNEFIYSYLTYCLHIWDNSCHANTLHKIHTQAAHIMLILNHY